MFFRCARTVLVVMPNSVASSETDAPATNLLSSFELGGKELFQVQRGSRATEKRSLVGEFERAPRAARS